MMCIADQRDKCQSTNPVYGARGNAEGLQHCPCRVCTGSPARDRLISPIPSSALLVRSRGPGGTNFGGRVSMKLWKSVVTSGVLVASVSTGLPADARSCSGTNDRVCWAVLSGPNYSQV